jgi:hypothetical protein
MNMLAEHLISKLLAFLRDPRTQVALFSLACLLLCSAISARADGLSATALLCPSDDINGTCVSNSGTTFATESQVFGSDYGLMSGSANATASYLVLKAYADTNLTNYAPGAFGDDGTFSSFAKASFDDSLTVLGTTVGKGFLVVSLTVSGTISNSGAGGADAIIEFQNNAADQRAITTSGTTNLVLYIPFGFGAPEDFQESLVADVINYGGAAEMVPFSYSGYANFADTVTLTDVEVTDSSGNPIPGVSIESESGTVYPLSALNAVATPESGTLVLVGFGLFALVGMSLVQSRLKTLPS